jgi:hypothetical protein
MTEQSPNNNTNSRAKEIALRVRWILFKLLNPVLALCLLALGIGEALAAPFLGVKWAMYALATVGCAIALFLGLGGLALDFLGSWAQQIHQGITSLHEEELRKLSQSQRRAASEKPFASSIN